MFVIKKLLENYRAKEGANAVTYDASQGDGGASLPGVPHEVLDRGNEMQKKKGTGYDQPYGTDALRKATAEQYWQLDASTGVRPAKSAPTDGGGETPSEAYHALTTMRSGRI